MTNDPIQILAWTLGYWDEEHSPKRFEDGWSSLANWRIRVMELFQPIDCFVASGTWSDPLLAPVPIKVINAGCTANGCYDGRKRHYGKAAFTAAMAYALNRSDWDLLITLDTDAL